MGHRPPDRAPRPVQPPPKPADAGRSSRSGWWKSAAPPDPSTRPTGLPRAAPTPVGGDTGYAYLDRCKACAIAIEGRVLVRHDRPWKCPACGQVWALSRSGEVVEAGMPQLMREAAVERHIVKVRDVSDAEVETAIRLAVAEFLRAPGEWTADHVPEATAQLEEDVQRALERRAGGPDPCRFLSLFATPKPNRVDPGDDGMDTIVWDWPEWLKIVGRVWAAFFRDTARSLSAPATWRWAVMLAGLALVVWQAVVKLGDGAVSPVILFTGVALGMGPQVIEMHRVRHRPPPLTSKPRSCVKCGVERSTAGLNTCATCRREYAYPPLDTDSSSE